MPLLTKNIKFGDRFPMDMSNGEIYYGKLFMKFAKVEFKCKSLGSMGSICKIDKKKSLFCNLSECNTFAYMYIQHNEYCISIDMRYSIY